MSDPELDPDPLHVVRIRTKMSRIPSTEKNTTDLPGTNVSEHLDKYLKFSLNRSGTSQYKIFPHSIHTKMK